MVKVCIVPNRCHSTAAMADEKPIIYGFPGKTKSVVWEHFGFYMGENGILDKSRAICRLCHHGVRYLGNTTNLHAHLTKHRRVSSLPSPSGTIRVLPPTAVPLGSYHSDGRFVSSMDENVVSSGQAAMLTNQLTNFTNRSESLNLLIGEFLIENMLPPDIVETQSFVNMIGTADPTYRVQPKQYYSDGLLTQLYDTYRSSLTDLIKSTPTASLHVTVDMWESKSKKTYTTISAHVITNDWNFESYVMSSKPKSDKMAEDLDEFWSSLDMQLKPLVVVGDPSVIEAPTDGIVIECLGSAINRAATNALNYKHVPKAIELARKLGKSAKIKLSIDDDNESGEHWIATYEMMSKILQKREKLASTDTSNVDEMLQTIEQIVSCLKPLKSAADHMLEQPELIVSLVLPVLRKLEVSLCADNGNSRLAKELKSEMWNSLKDLYQDENVKDYLLVSSLLDPRFKELLFVGVPSLKRARESLVKSATEVSKSISISEATDEPRQQHSFVMVPDEVTGEPSVKRIKTEFIDAKPESSSSAGSEGDWLSDVVSKKAFSSKEETQENVNAEIERYLSVEQTTSYPLVWWQSRQTIYPILARVARQYLCTPATSLPPEIMFNVKSHDVSVRRHVLPDKLIDKMVFLNSNYHKMKE